MKDDDMSVLLAQTVQSMLVRGCPCRYPRFRASCERDSKEVGAPGYTTWEQGVLVSLFEAKVPRADVRSDEPRVQTGRCAICGATYVLTAEEYFRDAWIVRLEIKPALPDIGAPLHTMVPYCYPFYAAGPHGRNDERHLLSLHFPQLSPDDWLAWLGAEAA